MIKRRSRTQINYFVDIEFVEIRFPDEGRRFEVGLAKFFLVSLSNRSTIIGFQRNSEIVYLHKQCYFDMN